MNDPRHLEVETMRGNIATMVLGFAMCAGALIACQAQLADDSAKSDESALEMADAFAPEPPVVAPTTDAGADGDAGARAAAATAAAAGR